METTLIVSKPYWLYLLDCKGDKFYTGIALNVEDRFKKHQSGKGAAYTRANTPLKILAKRLFKTKSEALKAECFVKKLRKNKKIDFFNI